MTDFKRGDKVRVISCCQSYGQTGVVKDIVDRSFYNTTYKVIVSLDNGEVQKYSNTSLERAGSTMAVKGNYNIAMVKFVQGTNTTKEYAFALFDNPKELLCIDDLVLCDTANGYGVAKIVRVIPQDEYEGSPVTKEVICKVDFTDYNNRKELRRYKETLKKQMDKMVADNQELILYQAIAEKNPEMAAMLSAYKSLANI